MTASLSKRLAAMALAIGDTPLLLDVGTDHALLPLAWLQSHPQARAIGIDRAAMPLARAEQHRGVSPAGERLELRLQDGLGDFVPDAPATLSISGMGGISIGQILERAKAVREKRLLRLVLAPNDRFLELREMLEKLGWAIFDEEACWERDHYYPILSAKPESEPRGALDPLELRFGPHLLAKGHPALARWLRLQSQRLEKIDRARGPATPSAVHEQLAAIRDAWAKYFAQGQGPLRVDTV